MGKNAVVRKEVMEKLADSGCEEVMEKLGKFDADAVKGAAGLGGEGIKGRKKCEDAVEIGLRKR